MEEKYFEIVRGRSHWRNLWALKAQTLFLVAFVSLAPLVNGAPPNSDSVNVAAEGEMARGMEAYQHGNFETAVNYWTDAADKYRTHSQHSRLSDALKYRAQALQGLGLYQPALKDSAVPAAVRALERPKPYDVSLMSFHPKIS